MLTLSCLFTIRLLIQRKFLEQIADDSKGNRKTFYIKTYLIGEEYTINYDNKLSPQFQNIRQEIETQVW